MMMFVIDEDAFRCQKLHFFDLVFIFFWRFEIGISVLVSHFSRTHSVSRSPSKLHWNLFERFFLDVHLAFTCAPASVHLTRKNAYAVVEQKIGTARYAHPNRLSLSGKNLAKLQLLIFLDFID